MSGALQKQDIVRQLLARSFAGAPIPVPFARDVMLASMHVAGAAFYAAQDAADGMRAGQRLSLRREPGNPHDGLAIEVLESGGRKLGYLPRSCNEIPARLMDAGKRLFLRLESIAKHEAWVEIQVTLYMEDY